MHSVQQPKQSRDEENILLSSPFPKAIPLWCWVKIEENLHCFYPWWDSGDFTCSNPWMSHSIWAAQIQCVPEAATFSRPWCPFWDSIPSSEWPLTGSNTLILLTGQSSCSVMLWAPRNMKFHFHTFSTTLRQKAKKRPFFHPSWKQRIWSGEILSSGSDEVNRSHDIYSSLLPW